MKNEKLMKIIFLMLVFHRIPIEQADTCLVKSNLLMSGLKNIFVRTNDTDVIVLLIASLTTFVLSICGVGKNTEVVCGLIFFHG